ncbi:sigma-54-dependent Fis family transcriptional regulator [Mesorhizobium sp. L-8-10]|uniref:sigma-54-dependent Fis family transcriptional regulator n=1 Tax=Mesorhizobium sp. L-8-10 TaxID=2744523 RepID=UPI001925CE22|nr:sigma-54-dependent Fis family transcriptional regulator [Mesorhizobium sp. L-8-10]BCH30529.1 sigma-54-dependent Fis family transcriptional regulator [Mesorhizobium sp. L-8-10]
MKKDIGQDEIQVATRRSRSGPEAGRLVSINADYDERITMRAWETLLSGEADAACRRFPVRSLIHDSWSRCATGGIDAQQGEAPINSGKDEIEYLRRANGDLLAAARRSFATIGRLLDGTGAMLVLADGDGMLIDAIGDKKTIHDGMDIHLAIGGKWTEDVVGTNGIGTALWTGEPVFVHAAEHFCAGIKSWTCAGSPIRDPFDGKVIGVVDLSGHPDIFRPHNTALVAAAAREIEKALADHQNAERTRLLEAFIASAPRYRHTDGLMIVDRRGRAIYRNNLPDYAAAVLADEPSPQGHGRRLQLPEADPVATLAKALPEDMPACSVSPLKVDGDLRGAALMFPSTRTARAARPSRPLSPHLREAAAAIVGDSDALLAAIDVACRVAQSREVTSLLIEGETGVGKELFARLVHAGSRRTPNDPFIAMNCGAITRELFGSELFGHVAGAFTGASREGKPGVFELANGGVLSLDEIGELPLEIQPFLLRVLEERVVHRVGDSRDRPVDVRLVASTNRDLKQEVAAGRFRRDLYYRIGTVSIHVPPLRERGADVLLLLDHFNRKLADRIGGTLLDFSDPALEALEAYRWPGNVRELRNLVERLHVLSRGDRVEVEDLPEEMAVSQHFQEPEKPVDTAAAAVERPILSFEDAERQAVINALAAEGGNLSRVARRLGISRPTLYRKLDHFGIRRGFV